MCFRPSAAVENEPQIQTGTCEKCGQPVAASIGITSGECPHCGAPIPLESTNKQKQIPMGSTPIISPFH